MINFIKGEVAQKGLDYVVIENNNIGYYISTSFTTLKMLKEGDVVTIFTYLHIREDILALYGFLKSEEIEMFKKLITVNGIGPKAGLAILSTYDYNSIKEIIIKEDVTKMTKVPGIGKKTASKIILELKDKVGTLDSIAKVDEEIIIQQGEASDIINALIALGFSPAEAKSAINNIDISGKSENDIIKEALKNIKR